MALIKTPTEIAAMRAAGRVVGDALRLVRERAAPGVRLSALAEAAEALIRGRGALPTFLGYHGFPGAICLSLNEACVHGVPSRRKLRDGDLLSADIGATLGGWIADAALTVVVGQAPPAHHALVEATRQALLAGVAAARPGATLGDVGAAIEAIARAAGCGVVEEVCGHGVGQALHEDPQVPNLGVPGTGPALQIGMCLAIEPVLTAGSPRVLLQPDGWTIATRDGGLSAHQELTIAIGASGAEVLTLTSAGELP
jgi:methionyl aminopeptidase